MVESFESAKEMVARRFDLQLMYVWIDQNDDLEKWKQRTSVFIDFVLHQLHTQTHPAY